MRHLDGLQGDERNSEQLWENVRRTIADFLQNQWRNGALQGDEPNGDQLWENVRRAIADFLHNQWRNGALQGEKAESEYFVKCDREKTAQNDIDNGDLSV